MSWLLLGRSLSRLPFRAGRGSAGKGGSKKIFAAALGAKNFLRPCRLRGRPYVLARKAKDREAARACSAFPLAALREGAEQNLILTQRFFWFKLDYFSLFPGFVSSPNSSPKASGKAKSRINHIGITTP